MKYLWVAGEKSTDTGLRDRAAQPSCRGHREDRCLSIFLYRVF
jgi:hypothetical protein